MKGGASTSSPKRELADLAVFGGSPAFSEALHVGRPNIGDRGRLRARLDDMLDRRWLTNDGPYVRELERRIADYLGVRHCVAVSNGTAALELAVRACGLRGEVIVPSFTFVATAHALLWQGLNPVFCDIDPRTHNIDPRRVEALITPRTSAILGVHVWGRVCDVAGLGQIAERHGLRLLFDAAHAFACSSGGAMVGGFGDAEAFSFHATKFFNTLEGGAVVTERDEVADAVRLMRNFGFADAEVVSEGTNAKMNEASAAMGLTLLEDIEDLVQINVRNYLAYRARLEGVKGVQMVRYDDEDKHNHQYVVLVVDETVTGVGAETLARVLRAERVFARRYFHPACHEMEPYRSQRTAASPALPETEILSKRVLCLPTGSAVGVREIEVVCQIIRFVVGDGAAVRGRMA